MVLMRLRPHRIITNTQNLEKYLRHLSNRLYYNVNEKTNFYSTKKFNSPELNGTENTKLSGSMLC